MRGKSGNRYIHKVFNALPWVMPVEPPEIREIFERRGRRIECPAGKLILHGLDSGVTLIEKGVVVFSFNDLADHCQIFSLCLPGCTVGDLESLEPKSIAAADAECIKPCTVLYVTREAWLEEIRGSVAMMEAYAKSANRKHWCVMEGMIANYTQPLEIRLRLFLYSLISSHYKIGDREWNPCPVVLTVTDIAKIVAANRSWVSRTLSAWAEQGTMKKDGFFLVFHRSVFEGFLDEEAPVVPAV